MGMSKEEAFKQFDAGKSNKELVDATGLSGPYFSKLRKAWRLEQGKKTPMAGKKGKATDRTSNKLIKKVVAKVNRVQEAKVVKKSNPKPRPEAKPKSGLTMTLQGDYVVFRVPVRAVWDLVKDKIGKVFG